MRPLRCSRRVATTPCSVQLVRVLAPQILATTHPPRETSRIQGVFTFNNILQTVFDMQSHEKSAASASSSSAAAHEAGVGASSFPMKHCQGDGCSASIDQTMRPPPRVFQSGSGKFLCEPCSVKSSMRDTVQEPAVRGKPRQLFVPVAMKRGSVSWNDQFLIVEAFAYRNPEEFARIHARSLATMPAGKPAPIASEP